MLHVTPSWLLIFHSVLESLFFPSSDSGSCSYHRLHPHPAELPPATGPRADTSHLRPSVYHGVPRHFPVAGPCSPTHATGRFIGTGFLSPPWTLHIRIRIHNRTANKHHLSTIIKHHEKKLIALSPQPFPSHAETPITIMTKEDLDSDKVNYMIWRYETLILSSVLVIWRLSDPPAFQVHLR